MAMKEIWKKVKGYEGLYQVSNLGKVKSLERYREGGNGFCKMLTKVNEKLLKLNVNKHGYYYVHLYYNNKSKTKRVNRLVAEAFIPNPNKLPEVNHIDCDKINNVVNNLEWCDRKYNMQHAIENGRLNNFLKK